MKVVVRCDDCGKKIVVKTPNLKESKSLKREVKESGIKCLGCLW